MHLITIKNNLELSGMEIIEVFISRNIKKKRNIKKLWRARVYGRYLYYCVLVDVKPVSNYKFYDELEKRGCKKTKDGQHYRNVELLPCKY